MFYIERGGNDSFLSFNVDTRQFYLPKQKIASMFSVTFEDTSFPFFFFLIWVGLNLSEN